MIVSHQPAKMKGPASVALGTFDGLHIGHRRVLSCALQGREQGMVPAVLTFEENPQNELIGHAPPCIITNSQKRAMFDRMGFAHLYMLPFSTVMNLTAEEFVKQILIDTLHAERVCCGFNYRFGKGAEAGCKELADFCLRYGAQAHVSDPVLVGGEPVSSTRIRAMIAHGEVEEAAALLGRAFSFHAKVVRGRQLGRVMGTPTLNQRIPKGFILPRFGVYASCVRVEDREYFGVTNVGVKPTVGSDAPLAETWMPNYAGGELYGRTVEVVLLRFLRPEQKFKDINALRDAIHCDAKNAEIAFSALHTLYPVV